MKISFKVNELKYAPLAKVGGGAKIQGFNVMDSRSLIDFSKFFLMYERGRKVKSPFSSMIVDAMYAIFTNCRLKIFKNKKGDMLAGYSYMLRKNSKGEKSLYLDGLSRNLDNKNSKHVMTNVYEDIKSVAQKNNVKEITLFNYAKDKNLRHNYGRLGFTVDEKCFVEKLYLMRVRTEEFLKNKYFQIRKYKEALGVDSILRKQPEFDSK